MESNYLYGASVQGIQSFIFQTNELKDIVGASELVENICTKAFEEFEKNGEVILKAAGNIKCIFNQKEDCERAILNFPKKVLEMAPGITISQAVVKMDEETDFSEAVNELEKRLRTQRNKPIASQTIGLMGMLRSRKTGLPAVEVGRNDNDYVDLATKQKKSHVGKAHLLLCTNAFGNKAISENRVDYKVDELSEQSKNNWIAVIHADGNGLGQIVQNIGKEKEIFQTFSQQLDIATKKAAQSAYEAVKDVFKDDKFIPIRPIVLGGDDFTVICRADFAIDYAASFLENFEIKTKSVFNDKILQNTNLKEKLDETQKTILRNGLTACAGIAFIKTSYPFYYGYNLAEALCSRAKKDAKANLNDRELPPSCVMFHKVQDSFVQDFSEIVKRELTPNKDNTFEFGPYYLKDKDDRWTIPHLMNSIKLLDSKEGNAVKSHLRQWMSLMYEKEGMAKQKVFRIVSMLPEKQNELKKMVLCVTGEKKMRNNKKVYPVYDILSLHSIINNVTK